MEPKRLTRQRACIEQVISSADRALSVEEIHQIARRKSPGIGLATIYRSVRSGLAVGSLSPVHVAGQPIRYERAFMEHHHHFHCHACNRLFTIEGCAPRLGTLLPAGFQLERHEITLHGRCRQCSRPG